MAEFAPAVEVLLLHEGGFVDHPDDPGGATNYGVSLRWLLSQFTVEGLNPDTFDFDGDGDVDANDIKLMPREAAIELYRLKWWNEYGYAQIADQAIATRMFSFSVNVGASQAHKFIQRACRACEWDLVDDGLLGPRSFGAINTIDPQRLLPALRAEAAGFYRGLVMKEKGFKTFLNGWLRRAYY